MVEVVDVWAIFVADPERTVTTQKEALAVERDPLTAGALASETIAYIVDAR